MRWAICEAWTVSDKQEAKSKKERARRKRIGGRVACLAGVEHKLGAACQALRHNHQIAQRRAVVDDAAIPVGDEGLLGAAAHDVDAFLVDGQPQILGQRRRVRLLGSERWGIEVVPRLRRWSPQTASKT